MDFQPPLADSKAQDETSELRPKFNSDGLIAAIVQDVATDQVLMFAWMNAEALENTLKNKKATFWSRSRQKLWVKGESSGHTQSVVSAHIDCDQDAILLKVKAAGPACHTERESCFYRRIDGKRLLNFE